MQDKFLEERGSYPLVEGYSQHILSPTDSVKKSSRGKNSLYMIDTELVAYDSQERTYHTLKVGIFVKMAWIKIWHFACYSSVNTDKKCMLYGGNKIVFHIGSHNNY